MTVRYEPTPWDIRRCDMVETENGDWVRYSDFAAAQAERDYALARIKTLSILSTNGYSAGYDAGVNAAVAKYEFAMKGDAHVYGIDQMMSLISNNSDTAPETENQKETEK